MSSRTIPDSIGKRLKNGRLSFQTGPGWNNILIELDRKLSLLDPDYKIFRVEERWATLRFFCSLKCEDSKKLIEEAEDVCVKTCETCGKPGKRYDDGLVIKVSCEEHKITFTNYEEDEEP